MEIMVILAHLTTCNHQVRTVCVAHVTTCDHCGMELYGDKGNTGTFDYLRPSGKNGLCCMLLTTTIGTI